MDLNKLADALIPDGNVKPLEYYEQRYPERALEKGAQVTRLAPSPTGFMHIGNLYVALANERIAHQSGGVFYLRIEDTDDKRKVEGAVEVIHTSLKYFGVAFDEGADLFWRLRSVLPTPTRGDLPRLRERPYPPRSCVSLFLYGRGTGKNARIPDGA